jgi:hypothetical protein
LPELQQRRPIAAGLALRDIGEAQLDADLLEPLEAALGLLGAAEVEVAFFVGASSISAMTSTSSMVSPQSVLTYSSAITSANRSTSDRLILPPMVMAALAYSIGCQAARRPSRISSSSTLIPAKTSRCWATRLMFA